MGTELNDFAWPKCFELHSTFFVYDRLSIPCRLDLLTWPKCFELPTFFVYDTLNATDSIHFSGTDFTRIL